MRHLFIINPAAGSYNQTEDYRKKIAEACEKRGLDYSIRVSGAPGRCCKIAREAAETGKEYRLYACGGDGTLNEVVSGAAGFPNVAVTVFSGGSGNDFCLTPRTLPSSRLRNATTKRSLVTRLCCSSTSVSREI